MIPPPPPTCDSLLQVRIVEIPLCRAFPVDVRHSRNFLCDRVEENLAGLFALPKHVPFRSLHEFGRMRLGLNVPGHLLGERVNKRNDQVFALRLGLPQGAAAQVAIDGCIKDHHVPVVGAHQVGLSTDFEAGARRHDDLALARVLTEEAEVSTAVYHSDFNTKHERPVALGIVECHLDIGRAAHEGKVHATPCAEPVWFVEAAWQFKARQPPEDLTIGRQDAYERELYDPAHERVHHRHVLVAPKPSEQVIRHLAA